MRKIQLLRETVPKRTRWLLCLLAAMSAVLGVTVSFGAGVRHKRRSTGAWVSFSISIAKVRHTRSIPDYSGGRYLAADPNGGYWTVNWVGAVTAHGGAPTYGSPALSGLRLNKPIAGIAATPDGEGYWLVGPMAASSPSATRTSTAPRGTYLNLPIVGIAATSDGEGYWLVGSDGGVFSFGDAEVLRLHREPHLNKPIVGLTVTTDGAGYWLVASDGGIFTFGDAKFYGSIGAVPLNQPIVGMAPHRWGGLLARGQ